MCAAIQLGCAQGAETPDVEPALPPGDNAGDNNIGERLDAGTPVTGELSSDATEEPDDASSPAMQDGCMPDAQEQGTCDNPFELTPQMQADGTATMEHAAANYMLCDEVQPADCPGSAAPGVGHEVVHRLQMPFAGTLEIAIKAGDADATAGFGQPWAVSTYVLTSCGEASTIVQCAAANAESAGVSLAPADTFSEGETVFINVDGNEDATGFYTLAVVVHPLAS